MANHGWAHLKRKTSPEEITGLMGQGNRLRFDGLLEVGYYRPETTKQDHSWEIGFKNEESGYYISALFFIDNRMRKFEWRHIADMGFGWWMQQWFAEYIVYQIDRAKGLIHDEGVQETWSPDYFIKFPMVTSWVEGLHSRCSKSYKYIIDGINKEIEGMLGSELWEVVSHEKKVLDTPSKR
jgi:hypothetical protein